MSQSVINTGFAKCFILFMSIVILLQGCCYLGLAIYGIISPKCSNKATDISAQPFEFVLHNLYFTDERCGNPVIILPTINQNYTLEVDWSKSYKITHRVHIFLITYAAVSALWIVTSLLILTTICGVLTKAVSAIFYWPWFLVVMAGCIVDAVATYYFASDIPKTMSAKDYLDYAGITAKNDMVSTYLSSYDDYFVVPSVIMTCITSRIVLIWLLNIFGTVFCLSLANSIAKPVRDKSSDSKNLQNRLELNTQEQTQELPPQNRCKQPRSPSLVRPKPLPIQQNSYQSEQQSYPHLDNRRFELRNSPAVDTRPSAPPLNRSESDRSTGAVLTSAKEVPSYRNADTHPDRLDYPRKSTVEFRAPTSDLSPTSPLNQRYSSPDGQQPPNPQQRVSDELRSQLPWSYTTLLSQTQSPSRYLPPADNMHPELPEPDYHLNTQRND